jgi:acetyl-CoA carboxylase biotin carboxyl carrier protein
VELRQIKELMTAMGRSGIKKLSLKKEGFELQLEGEDHHLQGTFDEETLEMPGEPFYRKGPDNRRTALTRGQELSAPLTHAPVAVDAAGGKQHFVTSPMVGTFYASAAPDEPPLVKPGDRVDANTVVCIIEAMKVMNEVKAAVAGVVAEVLVENGHPVEFGSKLFRIEQNL